MTGRQPTPTGGDREILRLEQRLGAVGIVILLVIVTLPLGILPFVPDSAGVQPLLFSMSAAGILLWILMDRVRVQVTTRQIRVGFPLLNSKIAISDLLDARGVPFVGVMRTGGFGVRLNFRGELCYIARTGPALRLRGAGRRLALLVGCDEPERVIAALREVGWQPAEGTPA